jgi:GNAT superfamily N-acetyltransferase
VSTSTTFTVPSGMKIAPATTPAEIARCFPAIRELRPHLKDEQELVERVQRQQREGFELVYLEAGGEVVSCIGYRFCNFLAWGRVLYVDDLVTKESARGKGYGEVLMDWIKVRANEASCDALHLDSGPQRLAAHRLYHRVGMNIIAYHFSVACPTKPTRR